MPLNVDAAVHERQWGEPRPVSHVGWPLDGWQRGIQTVWSPPPCKLTTVFVFRDRRQGWRRLRALVRPGCPLEGTSVCLALPWLQRAQARPHPAMPCRGPLHAVLLQVSAGAGRATGLRGRLSAMLVPSQAGARSHLGFNCCVRTVLRRDRPSRASQLGCPGASVQTWYRCFSNGKGVLLSFVCFVLLKKEKKWERRRI